MSDALIAFLRARLDRDERVARAATPGPWQAKPAVDSVYATASALVVRTDVELHAPWSSNWVSPWIITPDSEGSEGIEPADAEHIAHWHPARVLALIGALRRAVDEFSSEAREVEIIMSLAEALYADHPEYRAEWRPDAE